MFDIFKAMCIIAVFVLVVAFFSMLGAVGLSLSGCSQEMGSRLEVTDPNGVTYKYTEFKFNYFLYDRQWNNFNFEGLEFDELDGESKSVEIDLLRQKGSVK